MPAILRFEELEIWKQARSLSLKIFQLTQKEIFTKEFKFKEQVKSSRIRYG